MLRSNSRYLLEILANCSVDNITKERTWRAMAYGVQSNQKRRQTIVVVPDEKPTLGQQVVEKVQRFFNVHQQGELGIELAELNKTDNDIIPLV